MIKKFSYFFMALFVCIICTANGDTISEPTVIFINGIPMYETAVKKVFGNVKKEHNIELIENRKNIVFKDSDLVDEIMRLYKEAILDDQKETLIAKISKDDKILVYVDKKKKVITDVLIENYKVIVGDMR